MRGSAEQQIFTVVSAQQALGCLTMLHETTDDCLGEAASTRQAAPTRQVRAELINGGSEERRNVGRRPCLTAGQGQSGKTTLTGTEDRFSGRAAGTDRKPNVFDQQEDTI